MEFHHLGIATEDAEATASQFEAALDVSTVHAERFDDLEIRFLAVGDGYLELLEPVEEGPVARYLERNGPGIHHVALEPASIEEALSRAAAAGVDLIDEEPRPGAWGHEVAFLHPRSLGGVLVEFVGT